MYMSGKSEKRRREVLKGKTPVVLIVFFNESHSMETKIIEYGKTLFHKYKIEQTEDMSRLLFIFPHKL